jgi:hypothetical protein
MGLDDKELRALDEICAKGQVENLRNEIEDVIAKVAKYGFVVSGVYGHTQDLMSKTTWHPEKRIRINLTNPGINVFFDLLHEFGHVLDGDPGQRGACRS